MLNPNIILQGQAPDIVGAMHRGATAGTQMNQIQQENALAQIVRQHGPAAMGGDVNALGAIAGMGPRGLEMAQGTQANALNMDATRLGMDATRQDMRHAEAQEGRLSRQERRQIEQAAASMDASRRQAEAEQARTAVKMGMAAQSAQEWDSIMSQIQPELVGQFDQRQAHVYAMMDIADILESQQAPEGPNISDRYRVVGSTLFDLGAEGGPQPIGEGTGTETVVMGPDNKPVYIEGPAGTSAKFTETQSKDNVFSTRMRGALETLDRKLEDGSFMSDTLTSRRDRLAEMDPTGLARGLQSENFQIAQQAGTEFLLALLRKDTGAAVTPQEEITYGRVYLPRPGDTPGVLEAKRIARIRSLAAVESGMNPSQIAARDRALIETARQAGEQGATGQRQQSNNQEIAAPTSAADVYRMTPEARAQYIAGVDLETVPDDILDALIEVAE